MAHALAILTVFTEFPQIGRRHKNRTGAHEVGVVTVPGLQRIRRGIHAVGPASANDTAKVIVPERSVRILFIAFVNQFHTGWIVA